MRSEGGATDGVLVDLHLHSRASGTATNWWVKGLGGGRGGTRVVHPARGRLPHGQERGDGLRHADGPRDHRRRAHPHGTPRFLRRRGGLGVPTRGGRLCGDVLVYGLDGGVHREAQARRGNAHELVAYLREAGVAHVLAHPIYAMPGPLDRAAVERRLVMFGLWEFINGSRPAQQNRLAREIAEGLGEIELRQMALRHDLPMPPHRKISGTGGSDDHGGIYGGATYTILPKVNSTEELLEALAAGEVRPAGEDGSIAKMIQTGFRLAGAAVEEGGAGRAVRVLRGFTLRPAFLRRSRANSTGPEKELLKHVPLLARLKEPRIRAALAGRYEDRLSRSLGDVSSGFPALDFLSSIGSFIDGHVFIAPYVGVHGYFGRERKKARALRRELMPERSQRLKVGVFVDGMDGIHGVATMYRNVQALAGEGHAESLRIVRCGTEWPDLPSGDGVRSLRQVAAFPVPLYDGLVLGVPSLLDVLDHVAEEDYDVLHVATPGPLGLAALVAGIILSVPIVGAYHTEFGAYAEALSGDAFVAEIVDVAVREFYERCSAVAVPSQATALALRNRGYRIRRFEVLKNGVDTELFDPEKRGIGLHDSLGGGRTLLLYAGRVSREKGLDRLASGYLSMRRRRDDVHLVIAGDGPYRGELEAMLGDTATFTGFLRDEHLARLYASCDVFVFPSTTDTLGRAVAEAQASGLPAVVCGIGGPRECIRPGVSGFVADPGDEEAFFSKIELLLEDPRLRERMGRAAREFAGSMSWEAVLDGLIDLHTRLAGARPVSDIYARP